MISIHLDTFRTAFALWLCLSCHSGLGPNALLSALPQTAWPARFGFGAKTWRKTSSKKPNLGFRPNGPFEGPQAARFCSCRAVSYRWAIHKANKILKYIESIYFSCFWPEKSRSRMVEDGLGTLLCSAIAQEIQTKVPEKLDGKMRLGSAVPARNPQDQALHRCLFGLNYSWRCSVQNGTLLIFCNQQGLYIFAFAACCLCDVWLHKSDNFAGFSMLCFFQIWEVCSLELPCWASGFFYILISFRSTRIHILSWPRFEVVAGRGRVGKWGRQRKGGQTLDEDCL